MNARAEQLIQDFAAGGGVLSLFGEHSDGTMVEFLIAPEVAFVPAGDGYVGMIVYEPFANYTGGVHTIRFDGLDVVHRRSVGLMRGSVRMGCVQPADPDYPEMVAVFRRWKDWLTQKDNGERHVQAVESEYAGFIEAAGMND